ncbi:MAG: ABC transporter ATP-binding protein [Bacillus sp. (in: firmicutes)]
MGFLSLKDIHHVYLSEKQPTMAIKDISLDIAEGEFVSFLGPSGCGKTTLLSIIAGLIKPTAGQLSLAGVDMLEAEQKDIGYMLQQDYLFPWKTIKENILLGLTLQNSNNPNLEIKALKLLSEMGLEAVEEKHPVELSGGMRQRVALVRTLATDPKILLLDEPFSALDYVTKLKLEDLVSETLKQYGKTAVLVTHDIGEAIAMSDRIFLFAAKPGRLNEIFAVPEELRNRSPFNARNHPLYSSLFQSIWKELEKNEG